MDILLVNPPYFTPDEMSSRNKEYGHWIKGGNMYIHPFEPPLGLGSLCAYLREKKFDVKLIDMVGLMMEEKEMEKLLLEKQPPIVGITTMTPTLPSVQRIARLVKQVLPTTKVILGGVHPTVNPEGCLEDKNIDFIVRGEGEMPLEAVLSGKVNDRLKDIPGLCYKNGSLKTRNMAPLIEDLNSLPLADYASFPVERYVQYNKNLRGLRGISMLVSRGCPYFCSFCAVHQTMGRRFRVKSPERVVSEMEYLKEKYSLEGIWFKDSIFNLDKKWVFAFCSEIKKRDLKISWQYNTRVDLVDERELIIEKEAGLVQLDLGIESGSPKSLKTLAKGIDVDKIQEIVQMVKRHAKVAGFFMIGIPGEAQEDIEMTFDLAKKLRLDKYTWSLFSPLPGSALYNDLKNQPAFTAQIKELEAAHFTENPFSFCKVSGDKLRKIYGQINEYFSQEAENLQE
ncbi:MAG: radical SAM protein [Candidatus Omnitrophica bacterium]|nr:radical SAM protein [Candidatus Omnitrophota bacterium]